MFDKTCQNVSEMKNMGRALESIDIFSYFSMKTCCRHSSAEVLLMSTKKIHFCAETRKMLI